MEEIRVLTLHQPWASLIALGLKKYETRHWSTPYRGKLAIHAAKRFGWREELAIIRLNVRGLISRGPIEQINRLFDNDIPLGAIVAVADLSDCLKMRQAGDYTQGCGEICIPHQTVLERTVGNWSGGRYAWKLDRVVALPEPIPYKGCQGLVRIKDEQVLEKLGGLSHANG